jgi:hypothetical protein
LNALESEKIAFKVKLINYQKNNQNSAGWIRREVGIIGEEPSDGNCRMEGFL